MEVIIEDGAVELYYDNTKRFETNSAGTKVFGYGYISDGTIYLEKSGAHHHRILSNDAGNDLAFQQSSDTGANSNFTTYLRIVDGGAISLPQDSQQLRIGADNDIQLYHESGVNKWKNQGSTVFNMVDTGGDKQIECSNNGAVELYHNGSGKIITTSSGVTVTGSVTESSDIALKTNIEPINNVLDKIQQITGYTYKFKDTGHDSIGVTAQDVEKVFPELVHGEEGAKSLQYSGLIGALIESVKELSTKVAALEAA